VSKKRKKKQSPRAAQGRSAQASAAKPKTDSKAKSSAPTGESRRWVWPVVIVALVAVALLISQALLGRDKPGTTGPWTLTILHTTDVEGYLDPCG